MFVIMDFIHDATAFLCFSRDKVFHSVVTVHFHDNDSAAGLKVVNG